jgi:hypothetical protein
MLYTQGIKNNYFTNYFNQFIKYKINKLRKAEAVDNYVEKTFIMRNSFKILREKFFIRIRSSTYKPLRLGEFCQDVRDIWDNNHWGIIQTIVNQVDQLTPQADYFTDNTFPFLQEFKNCKSGSFKLVNLLRFMAFCGSNFEIGSISEIKGDSIVTAKMLTSYLKEFYILHRDNKDKTLFDNTIKKDKSVYIKGQTEENDEENNPDLYEDEDYDSGADYQDYEESELRDEEA